MRKDETVYLEDMLEQIARIEIHIKSFDSEKFSKDVTVQDAVVRCLEIIGEAARHLPRDFTDKHPQVPWRKIIGARDVLIHDYQGVDLNEVWRTVQNDLPILKFQIKGFIK